MAIISIGGTIEKPSDKKEEISLCEKQLRALTLGIQGIHEPISIMGNDWLNSLFSTFPCEVFGEDLITDPESLKWG